MLSSPSKSSEVLLAPQVSDHFAGLEPSAIRLAQIEHAKRTDGVSAVNVAIGNVSLPMHSAMQDRMFNLDAEDSPFKNGVVPYTPTIGTPEARKAIINILNASDCDTEGLYTQITGGGSAAMRLMLAGTCGLVDGESKPLLVMDPTYTNYMEMAATLGIDIVATRRSLQDSGKFTQPNEIEIQNRIKIDKPGALLGIFADNPSGQAIPQEMVNRLGMICADNNVHMVSDEAYRGINHNGDSSSIWKIPTQDIPGIIGKRIGIESASKMFGACGLRIGALVTDSKGFHQKATNEYTAELCAGAVDQYIFAALAKLTRAQLHEWSGKNKSHYKKIMTQLTDGIRESLPGSIVSSPDAAIYTVVDVRELVDDDFDAKKFVLYCAQEGKIRIGDEFKTLLVAPMAGFYNVSEGEENPGKTQMRIAHVLSEEEMALVPELFAQLFKDYEAQR